MAKRERTKRVRDKWKAKSWYEIHAPEMFNRAVLGETPSEEVESLRDRVIEVTVQDLTGDFSRMHIKVQFRVSKVSGNAIETTFLGHNMTSDYIRRLTRRKRSRIDGTFDVRTKEGTVLRVKPMAITDRRIQSSKQTAIRKVMHRTVFEKARSATLADFVKAMVLGDMAREVAQACKTIQPIFRVEIRRSELLAGTEVSVEPSAPEGEEAPEELEEPEEAGVLEAADETPEEQAPDSVEVEEAPPAP